jgi:hypothetical protein
LDPPPQLKEYEVYQPKVAFSEYCIEWFFLLAGVLIPILAAIMWRTGNAFERSGSLTVFCAAVAEFITLNRLTKKIRRLVVRILSGALYLTVYLAATCVESPGRGCCA